MKKTNQGNYIEHLFNYLFMVFVVIFYSCGEERSTTENRIDLLAPPESVITNLSDIATDVEYLPLQTIDSGMVGGVRDIKIIGDRIFVDSGIDIFCFDITGRFLFNLDKQGRGPGEYLYLDKYEINSDGNILVVLSEDELLVYSIENDGFSYLKTLSFKPNPDSITSRISDIAFIPGQNNILFSYQSIGGEPFRNIVIDLKGDTLMTKANVYKYSNEKKVGIGFSGANLSYLLSDLLHIKEMQSDTIFTINESLELIPYYILNCGGEQPTPEDFSKLVNLDMSILFTLVPFEDRLLVKKIIETERYLIYGYSYQGTDCFEVYDKKTDEKFGIDPATFFVDDISGGINFEPKMAIEGRLCYWVDAFTLKEYLSGDDFEEAAAKELEMIAILENLAGTLEETDNPVLIFVTPKQ